MYARFNPNRNSMSVFTVGFSVSVRDGATLRISNTKNKTKHSQCLGIYPRFNKRK